jgi:integrase
LASISKSKRTGLYRILFTLRGRRLAFRPGRCTLKEAKAHKDGIEGIVSAARSNSAPDGRTAAWLAGLEPRLRRYLHRLGVAPAAADQPPEATPALASVRAFIDDYIAHRRPAQKPRTTNNAEQDRDSLSKFLGPDRRIDQVTPGDADDFAVWLRREGYADATIGRRLKRCKQFFRAAVRKRLIADNPFADVRPPAQTNDARQEFISRAQTARLLEACPDTEWRVIVALARYGGIRTPSETRALTWGDVDWERGRVRIRSPKTEHLPGGAERIIPLFPELRPHLETLFNEVEPRQQSEPVISRTRDASANLRTGLLRIIRRAGLTAWPRVFHNLRASRETELAASYPVHVVCKWIGNTERIAHKAYLQVTDDDFEAALQSDAKSDADGSEQSRLETTEADNPNELSASVLHRPIQSAKTYPQGESNPCPLAENQIS